MEPGTGPDSPSPAEASTQPRRLRWLPAPEIAQQLLDSGPDDTGLAEELKATITETTADIPD
jgi:hypothetical protein